MWVLTRLELKTYIETAEPVRGMKRTPTLFKLQGNCGAQFKVRRRVILIDGVSKKCCWDNTIVVECSVDRFEDGLAF